MLPFDIPSFVEGETRRAYMAHLPYGSPTLSFNAYSLTEDLILALVFRGAETVAEMQALSPSPLRQKTTQGTLSQKTH